MYCKECGTQLKDGQNFCPKCGNKIERNNPKTEALLVDGSSNSTKPKNLTKAAVIAGVSLIIIVSIIIVVIVLFFLNNHGLYDDYLETHPINQAATNISYYCEIVEGEVKDFSCDLSTPTVVSSQIYDIDNDGIEELLQITIERDNTSIYPCLEITKKTEDTMSTTSYSFKKTNFNISTVFEGDYYIYKSDMNTYVLVNKNKALETSQYYGAGVINADNSEYHGYYFIKYKDERDLECYDLCEEKELISPRDNYSINNDSPVSEETQKDLLDAYNLEQMSILRSTFSLLGLKGFLTGTDDIDNIMNYNDITPIGKFSVAINSIQGNISYTDLIKTEK